MDQILYSIFDGSLGVGKNIALTTVTEIKYCKTLKRQAPVLKNNYKKLKKVSSCPATVL